MADLQDLQEKWVKKFARMRKIFPRQLVSPHLTVPPDGYDPGRIPSVLYVGKATGPNPTDEEKLNAEELRQKTGKFLKSVAANKFRVSGFCNFALRLSKGLKQHSGNIDIDPLQNLVWTNICKIGVVEGIPPDDKIYECQLSSS
jgi:hypothetical protein